MNQNHESEEPQEPQVPTICSICHSEPPINAVQLNCGHIFCHMCIKSVSEITGLCSLCRQPIGVEFNFKNHCLMGRIQAPTSRDGNYWFYEGFRGWWLYDTETNNLIEDAYRRGEPMVENFIAGCVYQIDLRNMTQKRNDGDGKSRKIMRGTLDTENILGIAGLKGPEVSGLLEMMKWQN